MSLIKNITASIVVYKEDSVELQKTINCFLNYPSSITLYIVDNSPNTFLKESIKQDNIEYVFSERNIGFGSGHNSILDKLTKESEYHLILNPDVVFHPKILHKLTEELKKHKDVSMIAPKVVYQDNSLQYTARKYPSVLELGCRFLGIFKNYTIKKEYKNQDLEKAFFPEFIHGNFMLFKTEDLLALNGFDNRYFLYMEDVDICKKIDQSGKSKLYYPEVEIIHAFKKGSSKNLKLFFIHISSIVKYFMKWNFKI
jgi:GT2 family glycosyltransferase